VNVKRYAVCSTHGRYDGNTIPTGKSEGGRLLWTLKHRKGIKGKVIPTHAVKAFGDSTGIAPGILNVGAR
jgi:hypothetical protein